MQKFWLVATLVGVMASAASAQEAIPAPGKHQHGHGTVNLAIEGSRVLIELYAPGDDIVGFEHPARTDEDRRAVERARKVLRDPLALFAMPAAAGCRVEKAMVALAGDARHEQAKEHAEVRQDGHMEFHAEYALHCGNTTELRRLEFPFFKLFPRSRKLALTVITDHGQTAYDVERDSPSVEMGR